MNQDINYWIARCASLEQELDMMKEQSIVNWQTGEPKEEGYYLVTFMQIKSVRKIKRKKGKDVVRYIEVEETLVLPAYFYPEYGWEEFNEVLAWCKLSDIKPFKEETK